MCRRTPQQTYTPQRFSFTGCHEIHKLVLSLLYDYFYDGSPLLLLTTSGEEHQVTGEEAGGGVDRLAVQEVDHVTHCVSRSEEGFEVQTAHCYWILVWERAGKQTNTGNDYLAVVCLHQPVRFEFTDKNGIASFFYPFQHLSEVVLISIYILFWFM